jgi:hypothetical protein
MLSTVNVTVKNRGYTLEGIGRPHVAFAYMAQTPTAIRFTDVTPRQLRPAPTRAQSAVLEQPGKQPATPAELWTHQFPSEQAASDLQTAVHQAPLQSLDAHCADWRQGAPMGSGPAHTP